ncbi:MAG TPA: diguanylate cyclase [Candidatus Anaerobiospirillum pullistercoris]|uniref:diguanylate cyclase n=1 Tax=Candidatus Anaerobiospirillum pullistercoris TaxID=2838452 RepID=A0A9D1WEA6_9GAMM|nr:diguanylate cyclase [Candidatus Anaerobiospirillum pullistercoris]
MSVTFLMVGVILVASICVFNYINNMERDRCFERLYEEARNISSYIERGVSNDREQLELLAAIIANHKGLSTSELQHLLSSFDQVGMMAHVNLLLPDNTMITHDGKRIDVTGKLSFEQEATKGAHISDRETDILTGDYIIRHFMPVIRDGQIVAMLYGVITLNTLPKTVVLEPYGGRGALYIIDGNNGDFLIDTWHPGQVGNIWQLGSRKMAPGYNPETLKEGVSRGDSNYVVFVSRTIGEHLYMYYTPMKINQWRISLSVPESVVFASSIIIKDILNAFLWFELICFAIYLLWMLRDVKRVTTEKQKRLDMIQHIQEIEHFLFNAHEKKENLYAAIEQLGGIIGAERISFWILEGSINQQYSWQKGQPATEHIDDIQLPSGKLMQYFLAGYELYEAYMPVDIEFVEANTTAKNISNLIAIPVKDVVGGQLSGVLAVSNFKKDESAIALLKAMSFSFGMFCNNVKNRADLQEQGDRDTLTGMYNRNRYERDLPVLFSRYQSSLTCIYIDVNGLREMNNTKGHDLGDKMLRTVAEGIKEHFRTDYSYRVGGDEFVLFVPGFMVEELNKCSLELASDLLDFNYHISVGIHGETDFQSLSQLIKTAEQKMYAQKRAFYATRERRVMHVA